MQPLNPFQYLRPEAPSTTIISDWYWMNIAEDLPMPRHVSADGGRPRCSDRRIMEALCFLYLYGFKVGDLAATTFSDVNGGTLRRRYLEWVKAGVPDRLRPIIIPLSRHRSLSLAEIFCQPWGHMNQPSNAADQGRARTCRRRRHGYSNAYRLSNRAWACVATVVPPLDNQYWTSRDIFDAIATKVLSHASSWDDLGKDFPSYPLVVAAVRRWRREGVLDRLARADLRGLLDRHSHIKWKPFLRSLVRLPSNFLRKPF